MKGIGKEVQGDGWLEVEVGVVCVVVAAGLVAGGVIIVDCPLSATVKLILDTCWCSDKDQKPIILATRRTQLASCCLSTCYLGVSLKYNWLSDIGQLLWADMERRGEANSLFCLRLTQFKVKLSLL